MRQAFLTLLLLFALLVSASAQELTVKSMEVAPLDLTASTSPVLDKNNQPCGLVKVRLAAAGAEFGGNVIKVVSKAGEYWVYMPQNNYQLVVRVPNFLPLTLNFRDYGIQRVEPKTTYVLTLLLSQTGQVVDDGMRYLAMTVEPTTATVLVDNELRSLTNGQLRLRLQKGSHSYSVMAEGYDTQQGTVTLNETTERLSITLKSVMAELQVRCATAGAEVYVNGDRKGTVPWRGTLSANNYEVELRLAAHRSNRQSITLQKSEQCTLDVPVLQPIVGALDVNYDPLDAEVWLDGKKLGQSPEIFRNILVGRHEVELRKSGYQPKKETVEIQEGQTLALAGKLEASAAGQASAVAAGGAVETFTVGSVSFRMVRVDGGTFRMGSSDSDADSDEQPVHSVTLSPYSIGETEVTQALWEAVMGEKPSLFTGNNLPVELVSWEDCQTFLRKLNAATGRTFRLPTEAEWEYAARGGAKSKGYKYSGSNDVGAVAWYTDNSGSKTHPVGTKQANELGLYDMSGNVWEWCQDWADSYSSSAQTDPKGAASGSSRVFRGGSWFFSARSCRSSYRYCGTPSLRRDVLGLRLAL